MCLNLLSGVWKDLFIRSPGTQCHVGAGLVKSIDANIGNCWSLLTGEKVVQRAAPKIFLLPTFSSHQLLRGGIDDK